MAVIRTPGTLVGVVGAGTMGAGIAQVAVQHGHRVAVFDTFEGAAARAVEGIGRRLDSLAAKGRLGAEAAAEAKGRLTAADDLDAFEDAVLVVEAVVEDLAVKRRLFADLENVVGGECVLATNTSSISISAIAGALREPERLVGMHFFNPAPLMPLVEVVSGIATDPECAGAVEEYARAWGKTTVRCASTPGFIVNRVARPFYAEALRAHEEGAASGDFATLDAVVRECGGFRMGPFELMDMIGLDVNLAVSTSVWEATGYDPRYTPAWTQKEYVAAGRLGRKSGRGFHGYDDGQSPEQGAVYEPGDVALPEAAAMRRRPWARLVDPGRGEDDPIEIEGGLFRLARSFGSPATSYGDGRIVVDLCLDYETTDTVAIAPAADTRPEELKAAVKYFQRLGKQVVVLEDVPGLVTTRTVARIVNEAVDALYRGDADEDDIDTAMKLGVNYPLGPLEWGTDLGFQWVCDVLDALEDTYRDGRYRPSPLLRRLADADRIMDRVIVAERLRMTHEDLVNAAAGLGAEVAELRAAAAAFPPPGWPGDLSRGVDQPWMAGDPASGAAPGGPDPAANSAGAAADTEPDAETDFLPHPAPHTETRTETRTETHTETDSETEPETKDQP
jgi:3-hydroxybutyryl-CoA dehydrogenase